MKSTLKVMGSNKFLKLPLTIFILLSVQDSTMAQHWSQVEKVVASDRAEAARFGYSVATSGDYVIVGAHGDQKDEQGENKMTNAGAVYIYKNNHGTLKQIQKIVASDRETNGFFGWSVAIEGDYVIVGASGEGEDINGANDLTSAGAAYIFKNNGDVWSEVKKVVASDRGEYYTFGHAVAISGEYAIVGMIGSSNSRHEGTAYFFKNNGGIWQEVQEIAAPNRESYGFFGNSVSIDGDYAIVGATGEDDNSKGGNSQNYTGAAYIFKNNGGFWQQIQRIVSSDISTNDRFGHTVAIFEDHIVVGAINSFNDIDLKTKITAAGSAYLFENNNGVWKEVQKIVASDRGVRSCFGSSVALSSDYVVIGAQFEKLDESGQNFISDAGATYIFRNNGGVWKEEQKLVALDREKSDSYGIAVAASEDHVIVGAYYEDHNVDGKESLYASGSIYRYSKDNLVPHLSVE